MHFLEGIRAHDTEQAGLPVGGTWDFVDAYEHRVCYHHGQVEWLLRAEERRMSSDNFGIADVCGKLEGLLAHFGQNPSNRLSLSRKQAACNSRLWSQVDTATDIRQVDGHSSKFDGSCIGFLKVILTISNGCAGSFAVNSEELGRGVVVETNASRRASQPIKRPY